MSFGVKTEPKELGELMISMLKGEAGFQAKELTKLTRWLSETLEILALEKRGTRMQQQHVFGGHVAENGDVVLFGHVVLPVPDEVFLRERR